MEQLKLQDNITEDELIELAKKAPPVPYKEANFKNSSTNNDVPDFINFLALKPGKNKVKTKFLYECYCKWSELPIHYNNFLKQFNKFFVIKKEKQMAFYHLNYKTLTILEKTNLYEQSKKEKQP